MASRVVALLRSVSASHSAFVKRVHAFRLPIRSPALLRLVQASYFCAPLVCGYYVMQATNAMARESLGDRGEKLLAMQRERRRRESGGADGGGGGRGGGGGGGGGGGALVPASDAAPR